MRSYNIWYDTTSVWQSISGGWTNDAYRQITLEKPATGELKTWLEANAVKMPLEGTWVFNQTPNITNTTAIHWQNLSFSYKWIDSANNVHDGEGTGITINNDEDIGTYITYTWETGNTTPFANNIWSDEYIRTITFTEPVQYQGNEEFVKWFTNNAKPFLSKGRTLNEYTWDEIHQISLANKATEYGFKVGDAKEVTLNGSVGYGSSTRTFNNQKYWVYVIGINHNEAKEGKGIAFQGFKTAQTGGTDIAIAGTNYGSNGSGMVINSTRTNSGGWSGSVAYNTIMQQWKVCFPYALQAVIRLSTLYTDDVGNKSTAASSVKASPNEVYYLAEYEVFGSNTYANINEPTQQAQYDYYKAGNSKVKYRSDSTGTAANWWLRSPYRSNSDNFCIIGTGGYADYYYAYASRGSAPCFKV